MRVDSTAIKKSRNWWIETAMAWTLEEVCAATGAQRQREGRIRFESVCIDSRQAPPRSLFVALKGARHDGHDYITAALHAGALMAVAQHVPAGVDRRDLLIVADTQRALGDLAAYTRRRAGFPVAAITGSNGKTTTKEMLASICEHAAFPSGRAGVLKTHENENNLVGMPLTLLRMQGNEAVAVLEMGMNARGEIARLTEIAAPDVGVITNVGPAHLEGLGSIAGVAAAKGELFEKMPPSGVIVVNMDDEWVPRLAEKFSGRRIDYGAGTSICVENLNDGGLEGSEFDLIVAGQRVRVRLPMAGRHNVSNALAAAAAAHALGINVETIRVGLETAKPPKMRMQVVRFSNGVTVVNDGYNANPASMQAALRTVAGHGRRCIAVIGEMRELGESAEQQHEQMGRLAAQLGFAALVTVGAFGESTAHGAASAGMPADAIAVCGSPAEAAAAVMQRWRPGDLVLLKGSRGPDSEPWVRLRGSRMAEVMRLLEAGKEQQ